MTGICLTIQGDSDNSNSFQCHSDITNIGNIDLLGGASDSESQWQGGDSNSESQWPGGDSDSESQCHGRVGILTVKANGRMGF